VKRRAAERSQARRQSTQDSSISVAPRAVWGAQPRIRSTCACAGGCPRCQAPSSSTPAVQVSRPGSAHEQQADQISDQIIRSDAGTKRTPPSFSPPRADEFSGGDLAQSRAAISRTVTARGESLPARERQFYEPRLGHSLEHIRVHADERAAASARVLGARAYTVANHIIFARGQYDHATQNGRALLAHELVHALQNSASADGGLQSMVSRSSDEAEPAGFNSTLLVVNDWIDSKQRVWKPTLLNPDENFAPLQEAETGQNTRLRNPDDLSQTLIGTDGETRQVPPGITVRITTQRVEKGVSYVYIEWEQEEGWVRRSELRNVHDATVPKGTAVVVEEVRALDEKSVTQISWMGGSGWVNSNNIVEYDLRGTVFGEGGRLDPSLLLPLPDSPSAKQSKPSFQERSGDSFISVKETKRLDEIIGVITNNRAFQRDPQSGRSLAPERIDKDLPVIVIEQVAKIVDGKEETLTHVIDFSGQEYWTSASNIRMRAPRIFAADETPVGNRLDDIEDPKARQALEQFYRAKVDEFLLGTPGDPASGKFQLPMHQALLQQAREFIGSVELQSAQPALPMPDSVKEEDGMRLNEDLIHRLDLYYRFLNHARLLFRPIRPEEMSGIRSFARAHELSTFFMLNPQQSFLSSPISRLEFVRQLVDIDGRDENTPTVTYWATPEQVSTLRQMLKVIDGAFMGPIQPQASAPAPRATKGSFAPSRGGESDREPSITVEEAHTTIETIVRAIQEEHRVGMVGGVKKYNPKAQGAQAAEGYPRGDPRRRPNIRDTGISNHCGGEAVDIFFAYRINYFDPIIDALALQFGLRRPAKDNASEYWHFERIGVPLGEREEHDDAMPE
jgi:Domain of unknown function (DUF4157)